MSARIKGLIDFVLEINPKYIIVPLLSMYPPIRNIILPPPPGATAKEYEIPLYMYFLVAFAVCFWHFIRCRYLKYIDGQSGISHKLAQNQDDYVKKVAQSLKLTHHGMDDSSRTSFATNSKTTLTQYKACLCDSVKNLEDGDENFFKHQVNEMENVLEFMSDFEAELEKIDSKVHQQHNGHPANLEADLQKLSSLCNKQKNRQRSGAREES